METNAEKPSGRLGGAKADFVATLGRKLADARSSLSALEQDSESVSLRDELRRKLHAIGSGARLFRFESMTRSLEVAEDVIASADQSAQMSPKALGTLADLLDDLPALAWEDVPRTLGKNKEMTPPPPPATPATALVLGSDMLSEALLDARTGTAFACERAENVEAAMEMARSLAPDLVVLDADVDSSVEFVEALLDDPLMESVPVVVVGSFGAPTASTAFTASVPSAARFVALGVAKVLAKPISFEVLRMACEEALAQRQGRTVRVTLGEPTVEQLGERLADEVRNAIVQSVSQVARAHRVPLGEGSEVFGAMWGAIARVREIVTARTNGTVRFQNPAPENAMGYAAWAPPELARADRSIRARSAASEVDLTGRRVIVADDDPGVTWFLADLLRTAGCEVYEALHGGEAFDLAQKVAPHLVLSDILMPELDGVALSRLMKRDVALRDTPIVLLSWKEDLLQRVSELGALADAYMRKESDARAVLARVREVMRPRARIEARIKAPGEVRGRLDGITIFSLLEMVCTSREHARISVRDAAFLYEVEVRGGAPRRATRSAVDGTFQRGSRVLSALLGVRAGRFIVAPSPDPIDEELEGPLADQLREPVARARAAMLSVSGARFARVHHVTLDVSAVEDYLRATPEPARSAVRKLCEGVSPRALLGTEAATPLAELAAAAPVLVEDLLADLAARGMMVSVVDTSGVDLLAQEYARTMDILRPKSVAAIEDAASPMESVSPHADVTETAERTSSLAAAELVPVIPTLETTESQASAEPSPIPVQVEMSPMSARARLEESPSASASLEDALIQELSHDSPAVVVMPRTKDKAQHKPVATTEPSVPIAVEVPIAPDVDDAMLLPRSSSKFGWIALGVGLLLCGAVAVWALGPPPARSVPTEQTVPAPGAPPSTDSVPEVAPSPEPERGGHSFVPREPIEAPAALAATSAPRVTHASTGPASRSLLPTSAQPTGRERTASDAPHVVEARGGSLARANLYNRP